MNCAKCGAPVRGHFKIERINADGNPTLSAVLCSVACAIPWFYGVATMAGAMGMMRVKSAVGGFLEALAGPKKVAPPAKKTKR